MDYNNNIFYRRVAYACTYIIITMVIVGSKDMALGTKIYQRVKLLSMNSTCLL